MTNNSFCMSSRVTIVADALYEIERMIQYFRTPVGNPLVERYHGRVLPLLCSPDSSGIQEQVLAEACQAEHKGGGKKLGADASLHGNDVEIKPCKSENSVPHVNITDDQPSRLLKDIKNPNKILVIGRCPGGITFRWVIACLMSDFAESRYLAMCNHWKHMPEPWPSTLEDQVKVVEALAEKRTKNTYFRSSTLKFKDIKTVLGGWVHPDIDVTKLKKREEDNVILKIQRSVLPTALSHLDVPVLAM